MTLLEVVFLSYCLLYEVTVVVKMTAVYWRTITTLLLLLNICDMFLNQDMVRTYQLPFKPLFSILARA